MFAKLKDNGYLEYPKTNVVLPSGRTVTNPTDEMLIELGFKKLIRIQQPDPVLGFYFTSHFEETDDQIVEVWDMVEQPESEAPESERILSILVGEAYE